MSEVRFVAVSERFAMCTVFFFVIALLLSACASSEEGSTTESTSQPTVTVPGEKMSDEGRVTPGAGGSSANVHW
jgi:preprotein translocase subunit SecG